MLPGVGDARDRAGRRRGSRRRSRADLPAARQHPCGPIAELVEVLRGESSGSIRQGLGPYQAWDLGRMDCSSISTVVGAGTWKMIS